MSKLDWAAGVTEFSVEDKYSNRHTDELCLRCGAKPGYLCFEYVSDLDGNRYTFPVQSHILLREVPVRYQALTSGRSRAGC